MKKILMTAVAVSALSAGAVSAATISNTTTIAGRNLVPAGNEAVPATTNPLTLATEQNVGTAPGLTATSALVITPTANSVGQGSYVITYNITGGTFTTAGVTAGALGSLTLTTSGGTSSTVASLNTVNANSISFNVTIAAGEFLTSASFANDLRLGTTRANVAVDGSITTATGNPVDGGAIASKTLIDYRTGYKFTVTPAATNTTLSLASGYKKFGTAALLPANDATSAALGTVAFGAAVGGDTADKVYILTNSTTTTQTAVGDLTGAVLTLAGDLSAFAPTVAATAPDTGTTNVFTSTPTALGTATVALAQKAVPVAGNASAYSISPVVTMATGFTAPTFTSKALASVTLEGTNFYAAWVGDGTNGIGYTIRLGNRTSTAATGVVVTVLNSTATPTATSCAMGSVPASGELLITSAALKTCLGDFGRADLRITVQASPTSMTAKLRSVSAGVINEQSLGGGTAAAQAE
jgi:hypothetical protein